MTFFPKIGMRMVKTAVAVAFCFLIAVLIGGVNTKPPIFSSIAAIICMQPYVEHSKNVAFNRIIGTIIGALFGLIASSVIGMLPISWSYFKYVIISFAVIPVMYTTVLMKKPGASALAGVVLLSVTLSTDGNVPLVNAINRSVETIIGILVSLGVNMAHLPRRRERGCLFVSGFDGALYGEKTGITPYCTFELNQLLKDGIAFTIATERTPASLLADLGEIDLHVPVIAMDGAVLYDVKEKRYLACIGLSKDMTARIEAALTGMNIHYFLNVVWQDVLLIFYKDFQNDEEQKLYEQARLSPHRNYVYGERPEDGHVVYFLVVVTDEAADRVEDAMGVLDTEGELIFLRDKTETPPEYCHLKIYHKNATKEYMMGKLLDSMEEKKIVVFGSNKNDVSMMKAAELSFATADASEEALAAADYHLGNIGGGGDNIVRTMFHLYEPLPWQKLPKELQKENR